MTGVLYTDTRTGEEYEQPAGIVVLSAYVFGNISLLFNSGIGEPYDPVTGKGAVGKNYCYQLSRMGVTMFFEGQGVQSVHGRARRRHGARRCRRRQFRPLGAGLPRRRALRLRTRRRPPIGYRPVPPGTPRWGAEWKQATAKWYPHAASIAVSGSNYANRNNYHRSRSDL